MSTSPQSERPLKSIQHTITSTITTVFTAFTSFGLLAVSAWFASERWAFAKHSGKKWLSDIIFEATDRIFNVHVPGGFLVISAADGVKKGWKYMHDSVEELGYKVRTSLSHDSNEEKGDIESNAATTLPITTPPNSPTFRHRVSDAAYSDMRALSPTPIAMTPTLESGGTASILEGSIGHDSQGPSLGRQLWQNAIRTVRMRSMVTSNLAAMHDETKNRTSNRQRRRASSANGGKLMKAEIPTQGVISKSRIATLTPQLKCLAPIKDLLAHQALVKHMQFSPDGKYLATSRSVTHVL